jgi:chorismate mutase/prephenate dehydratase
VPPRKPSIKRDKKAGPAARNEPARAPHSTSGGDDKSPAELRKRLKRLDRELLERLNEYGHLLREISALDGSDTLAASQPDAVDRAVENNKGPLDDMCVRAVYRELVSGCRALTQPLKVAFLGPMYSYSHLAAVERFGQSVDLIPVTTIAAVFESVHRGDVSFGLVPIENSTDGRIVDTLDMFVRLPVKISGEVQLRIHHNLLGRGTRAEVREVCSKPQAISQCRRWLADHLPATRIVESPSTAAAAQRAADEPGVAAIASTQAGATYGLDVLAARIEDNKDNVTRFAIIGGDSAARTGADITSLMFQLPHRPGSLAEAMAIFKRNRLNLTWIESFPLRGAPNEYLFFVELEGHESDVRVRRAISLLGRKTERLDILGSYTRTPPIG